MRTTKAALLVAAILFAWAKQGSAETPAAPSSPMVTVGDHRLAFHVFPGGSPILVLDAGGGLDSSYWQSIIPDLAKQTGSEIITYDRAGFGASDEVKPPFKMKDAVADLEAGLKQLGATHDLILVPHSFAGEIATYLALKHPSWVSGAVLVDTNVPNFFTDEETQHQYNEIQPQVAAMLTKHSSKETRTTDAIVASMVDLSHSFHAAMWPLEIPCVVIVSEETPFSSKPDAEFWRQAHADFAREAPDRVLLTAKGSSHDVVHDRPDVIIQAVGEMVDRLRSGKVPSHL